MWPLRGDALAGDVGDGAGDAGIHARMARWGSRSMRVQGGH